MLVTLLTSVLVCGRFWLCELRVLNCFAHVKSHQYLVSNSFTNKEHTHEVMDLKVYCMSWIYGDVKG